MNYLPIAFKVNGCISLADFDRMWDDLLDMGVSLTQHTFHFVDGFLYVEGDIPDSWKTAKEVKKYCMRTGGIDIDARKMREWRRVA